MSPWWSTDRVPCLAEIPARYSTRLVENHDHFADKPRRVMSLSSDYAVYTEAIKTVSFHRGYMYCWIHGNHTAGALSLRTIAQERDNTGSSTGPR